MANKRICIFRNVNPTKPMLLKRVKYPHTYVLDPLSAISVQIDSDNCYVGIDMETNTVTIDFGETV